ncbi:MAG: single-stranded DNA-binding protein [Microscillaceae bacterium]|jgi:single-strand DNA-binding protein|nr:single-stranded DNA-binding protein [Microscillaceae bacterium]
MASLNRIMLIGNVGRDPESRDYQGTKVVSFTLAVNERYTKDGKSEEKTQWFRITFWGGNSAEVVMNYVKKGSQVYVDGRLSTSEYVDREGKTRTALEVRGQTITLLGSAGVGGGQGNNNMSSNVQTTTQTDNTPTMKESAPVNSDSDDLPF